MKINEVINSYKVQLNQEFLAKVKPAIVYCWGQIAGDVPDIDDDEEAIEMCIDADRLLIHGGKSGKEADELISAAYTRYGDKTMKFLAKNIKLGY